MLTRGALLRNSHSESQYTQKGCQTIQKEARRREAQRKKKEEEKEDTCALKFRCAVGAAALVALVGQGRSLLDPPWPFSLSVLAFAALLAAPS